MGTKPELKIRKWVGHFNTKLAPRPIMCLKFAVGAQNIHLPPQRTPALGAVCDGTFCTLSPLLGQWFGELGNGCCRSLGVRGFSSSRKSLLVIGKSEGNMGSGYKKASGTDRLWMWFVVDVMCHGTMWQLRGHCLGWIRHGHRIRISPVGRWYEVELNRSPYVSTGKCNLIYSQETCYIH